MNDLLENQELDRQAMNVQSDIPAWGLLAKFERVDELFGAIEHLRGEGLTSLEAYTPFPVEGIDKRLGLKRSPMPWIILTGGFFGGASVYALEYWINLYAYPLNIGGRPLHSWPAFIPAAFEGTILIAAMSAVFGVIFICGLPRLHHPVFEIEAFKRASTDGFFLAIKSEDVKFNASLLKTRLNEIGACDVWEVPDV